MPNPRGDIVWLNGTTIDEVESTHKATLVLALEETNRIYLEFLKQRQTVSDGLLRERNAHQEHVTEVAKKITFD